MTSSLSLLLFDKQTTTFQRRARVLAAAVLVAGASVLPARAREAMLDVTVVRSDTLYDLSRKVLVSASAWYEVARINKLSNPNRIVPGQVLRIPVRLMKITPINGQLVSVLGDVRIGGAPASAGMLIREGQTVQTALSSSTVIELADGSRMKLPPSSLALLATSRRYGARPTGSTAAFETSGDQSGGWFAGALRVLRGSVEVFATKVLRAQPLEVRTTTAVVGVRGTHYRVGLDDDIGARTHAEVFEGSVRFDVPGSTLGVDLTSGFGATTVPGDNAGGPVVVHLLPAPDLSEFPVFFDRPVVSFSLLPATSALRVQVAADESFDKTVRDQRFESGAEIRLVGLEDAKWYLRVRRVDAQGIEGYDSTRSFVLKTRPEPAVQQLPRADSVQSVGTVDFAWSPSVDAPSVRLQVAQDREFTRLVVDRDHLGEASLSVEMKVPAPYFWRLQSIRANGERGPFGEARRFELSPTPERPIVRRSADGQTLILTWAGQERRRYQMQLARDAAFTDAVRSEELDEPQWVQSVPEDAGRYFFHYRTLEPGGFISNYSETLTFEIPKNWRALWVNLPLLAPLPAAPGSVGVQ